MALTTTFGRRGVCACLVSLWVAQANAATPEDARRDYDAGRFTDAMGIWADLSREGNAQAEYGLGLLYDLGNGVKADPEAAFFWYKSAAEAGLPQAQFNLAVMYDSGRGVRRDASLAALWYAQAAAQGNHRAQYNLGMLYQQGDGVPRNPAVAAAWFRAAEQGGVTAARDRLAICLHEESAASHDRTQADPPDAVSLIAPGRDATLISATGQNDIELVWTAPAGTEPVRFDVRVRVADQPALTTVFTASLTQTAIVVHLPATPNLYVWNVDSTAPDGSRVDGSWSWFSIGGDAKIAEAPRRPSPAR